LVFQYFAVAVWDKGTEPRYKFQWVCKRNLRQWRNLRILLWNYEE